MYRRILVLLGVALMVGGVLAAACTSDSNTDDLEDRVATLEQGTQAVHDAAQQAGMMTALNTIAAAELHALDEATNTDKEIPAGAAGPVNRAVLAVAVVEWPDDLQADADDLQAKLQTLSDALEAGDVAAAGSAAAEAHEASHEFTEQASNYLLTAAGLPTPVPEEESTTPEAGTTPEAEATPEAGATEMPH